MIRAALVAASLLCLAGCNARFGGPALISGQSPEAANSAGSEPQPVNSLPPGAQGIGGGPLATAPNEASVTVGVPRL